MATLLERTSSTTLSEVERRCRPSRNHQVDRNAVQHDADFCPDIELARRAWLAKSGSTSTMRNSATLSPPL
jgi:hypothetical protein